MSYQEKYTKYKNKYLNLLNQIGSAITGSQQDLQIKLQNPEIIVGLYAQTAPNDCASTNMKFEHFNNIEKVVKECNPDGLIIYDIQEEDCKTFEYDENGNLDLNNHPRDFKPLPLDSLKSKLEISIISGPSILLLN